LGYPTNEARIRRIGTARTQEEFATATEGYREYALAAEPTLRANGAFNVAPRALSYFNALENVRRVVLGRRRSYR